MLYTLTLIRMSLDKMVFQNTERNQTLLLGDLEKELANHKATFSDVEQVLEMKKGDRITITVEDSTNNKLWFYYINKVS